MILAYCTRFKINKKGEKMEASRLTTCINRLHFMQALYITFKKDAEGIAGLRIILALNKSQAIRIDDIIGLLSVAGSGNWESVSRTISVYGMQHLLNQEREALAPSIENINTGEHFAKKLFTNNSKRRREAADEIIREVLTNEFKKRTNDEWGYEWTAELFVDPDDMPMVAFTAWVGRTKIIVDLDGFTGRVFHAGYWSDKRFSTAQQVREELDRVFLQVLESTTAAA